MSESTPIVVPTTTVNDETVRVVAWFVTSGQQVEHDALLGEVETSKAVLEIRATARGYVWFSSAPGDDVALGSTLALITTAPGPPPSEAWSAGAAGTPAAPAVGARTFAPAASATPLVRLVPDAYGPTGDVRPARLSQQALRLAVELGLDPSRFPAGSLVRRREVSAFAISAASTETAPPASATQARSVARTEALSRRKLAEVHVLAEGARTSLPASVSVAFPLRAFRSALAARGMGGGASAALIAEVARLLRTYPAFNAVLRDGSVDFFEEINIGWAIDDGAGLVVPVVTRADTKTLDELEAEIQGYLAAYVRGRISALALRGATFTISDLSSEGAASFVPLLSSGQSAILGTGTDVLTLTFDHQIADGRLAACFLRELGAGLDAVRGACAPDVGAAESDFCERCGRTARELLAAKTVLIRCAVPEQAFVCGLCLAGY